MVGADCGSRLGSGRGMLIDCRASSAGVAAALAALSPELSRNAEVRQGVHGRVRDQEDTATMTTVATVRTASLDVLFPPETETAVATVAGLHTNSCFIDELHGGILVSCPLSSHNFSAL